MSDLAKLLWEARRSGRSVSINDITPPTTDAEAYAVQRVIAELSGQQSLGFKVGSTSAEAQRLLGTTEPGTAPLLASYVFESPASISVAPAHMPAVEGEFAFKLARDLPPRAALYDAGEVADAVAAVAGAIEVVGTRLAGGLAGKGRFLVTADGGANIAFVGGAWCYQWRRLDLRTHAVAMIINGVVHGKGTGARALGDPLNVLLWLANQQSAHGRGLKAGEIVSTGTCTGLDPVAPGDHAQAEFGELGTVAMSFR